MINHWPVHRRFCIAYLFPIYLVAMAALASRAEALSCNDKPNRYRNRDIFTSLKETPDILYGQNKNPLINNQVINLSMDIFEPAGDTCSVRPVIIFFWGGGFQSGTRKDETGDCRQFARRGYVCVTADYRKGASGVSGARNFATPAFMSTQDARAANRFLRKNAALYRIDTSLIFVGGCSSGAYAASWTGYLDQMSEIPKEVDPAAHEGGIEGNSGTPGYSSKFAGVLALSGAVYDTNWIKAGDIPYSAVQCKGDATVNPDGAIGGSGMRYYGGNPISARMNHLGIPNRVLTYPEACHCPHPLDNTGLDRTIDFFAKSAYEFMTLTPASRVHMGVALVPEDLLFSKGVTVFNLKGERVGLSQSASGKGMPAFRPGLYLKNRRSTPH